jgi:hypothetical protein
VPQAHKGWQFAFSLTHRKVPFWTARSRPPPRQRTCSLPASNDGVPGAAVHSNPTTSTLRNYDGWGRTDLSRLFLCPAPAGRYIPPKIRFSRKPGLRRTTVQYREGSPSPIKNRDCFFPKKGMSRTVGFGAALLCPRAHKDWHGHHWSTISIGKKREGRKKGLPISMLIGYILVTVRCRLLKRKHLQWYSGYTIRRVKTASLCAEPSKTPHKSTRDCS